MAQWVCLRTALLCRNILNCSFLESIPGNKIVRWGRGYNHFVSFGPRPFRRFHFCKREVRQWQAGNIVVLDRWSWPSLRLPDTYTLQDMLYTKLNSFHSGTFRVNMARRNDFRLVPWDTDIPPDTQKTT